MTVIKAWNSGTSTWEVIAVGAQGPQGDISSSVLNDLSDVTTSSVAQFQTLSYDGTNWTNTYSPVVSEVRNVDTVTLPVGTVVYLSGATGDRANVKRADNTAESTSSKTVGIVATSIAVNGLGSVVTRGYVTGVNLTGYTSGDILYLSTAGGFTTTKPSAPNHLVFVGIAVRCNSNGIVYVAAQNGYELDELHNVQANSPSTNDFLKYNGTLWINSPINLSTDTTNTLPIARGGTNNTSLSVTNGGSVYADGSKLATTAAGTSGQVLTSSGAGAPTWSSAPSKLPFGRVASASTTSSTSVSALTALTNLTCGSYTYSTSRWYRITVTLQASQFLASAINTLYPYVYNSGGAKLFDLPTQAINTTDVQAYSASIVTNTLSGSLSIQAAANVSGGTIIVGGTPVIMSIIVEDIGPV